MRLLVWTGAALLLILAVLVMLPFSAAGTRLLAGWLDGLESVRVEYRAGSLFGDLELVRVSLDLPGVIIDLSELQTRLRLECLWTSRFCLSRANVGAVSVQIVPLPEPVEEGADNGDPPELVDIPYPIEIEALEVGSVSVAWEGGRWQQARLAAAVDIESSRIRIAGAEIDSAGLYLEAAEPNDDGYEGFVPPEVFIPLTLQVDGLDLAQGSFQVGEQALQLQALHLAGRWRGSRLTVESLRAGIPDRGEVELAGTLQFDGTWSLEARAQATPTEGWLPAPIDARQWQVVAGGDFAGLQLEVNAAGVPALLLSGELAITAPGLPFAAQARVNWPEAIGLGSLLPDAGLPPDLYLAGPLNADVSGTLESQSLRIETVLQGAGYEALEVRAEGQWQAPRLAVNRLELRDQASASQLLLSGTVDVADAWRVAAQLDSDGLQLPALSSMLTGRIAGGLALHAQGSADSWTVAVSEVAISGEVNALPASLRGSAGVDDDLRLLPGNLEGDVNGTQLRLYAEEGARDAHLYLTLDSLARWLPGAEGQVTVEAHGDLRGEGASLQGGVVNLRYAGLDVPELRLTANWRGTSQRVEAHLDAPELRVEGPGLEVRNVALALVGTPQAHQLTLQSSGDVGTDLSVSGAVLGGDWEGVLQPNTLLTRAERWELEQPVAMAWRSQAATLDVAPHCWRHAQFNLCGSRLLAGRTGDLQLRLEGDVRAFNGLLPRSLRVNGPMQATLAGTWGDGVPLMVAVDGDGKRVNVVRSYGMGERVKVTWEAARFRLLHEGGETRVSAQANREGRTVVDIAAVLPPQRDGALQGRFTLNRLQLATLSPWVTELSTLRGEVSGELALAGTLDDPLFSGELSLQDGQVVVVGNPTELTELALNLSLRDNRGTLAGSGQLGGGPVSLAGEIVAQPALRVSLQVRGTRHQVLVPPASELVVSEELQLVLTGNLLEATGWVRVHEGVLRHEELPEGGVSMSRDVVVVDVTGQPIREERAFEIRSDIVLRIDERFRVEGEQLNATLGGELQLVQEPGRPLQVFGTLQLLGGELNAYKQRLQIQRGTIAFSGPPDNPELNIAAEREIRADNVTVGARLFGRLEEPELEIYSNPLMSQSEAMSYLVRGRPLDSGAGADGTALALSLGADAVNQSGIVRELNRLPLISNVAFGTSGEADETSATVSGYIGERIYLSYGIGIYEPINVLTARLYLQSRLWLEVVSRLENSIDLYYAFEIE